MSDDDPANRLMKRRKFLLCTGASAGTTLLAGCPGGQEGTPTADQSTATPTAAPTAAPTETPTPEETETPVEEETPTETGPSLQEQYPRLSILSADPENAQAANRVTYTKSRTDREAHYIRNHYPSPSVDIDEWSVSLTGAVGEEVELSMDEIKNEYSTRTITHTMQCSGNGRSYFDPQVGGNQWSFGAVGNAAWTGSPLSEILEDYGAETGDEMWLTVMGGDNPEGKDVFTRSIPMDKVMDDVLLAYRMNGEPMTPQHGYPVRLLVPGWYGNNNVKWVKRMHVMDMMVFGNEWEEPGAPENGQRTYTHWQQYSYRIFPQGTSANHNREIETFDTREQMESDEVTHPYMYDQMVKSLIGHPGEGETVETNPAGQVEVVGVAWAGDDAVDTVEVSADGGESWGEAEFFGPSRGDYSWRLFRYMWTPDSAGEYDLVSRATDNRDFQQPATVSAPDDDASEEASITDDQYPWNTKGYANTAYMPHSVSVTVESS